MTKIERKAKWMRQFSEILYTLDTAVRGKVCWDTATHLYNIGLTPSDAAHRYVS